MLFLDGFGGATMQRYVAATETSESRIEDVASGTYVRLDSASGYYEYDVSFADGGYENFRFAYGTITVGNSAVAVYILTTSRRRKASRRRTAGRFSSTHTVRRPLRTRRGKTRRNRKPRGGHGD